MSINLDLNNSSLISSNVNKVECCFDLLEFFSNFKILKNIIINKKLFSNLIGIKEKITIWIKFRDLRGKHFHWPSDSISVFFFCLDIYQLRWNLGTLFVPKCIFFVIWICDKHSYIIKKFINTIFYHISMDNFRLLIYNFIPW